MPATTPEPLTVEVVVSMLLDVEEHLRAEIVELTDRLDAMARRKQPGPA